MSPSYRAVRVVAVLLAAIVTYRSSGVDGLKLSGEYGSYAQYPTWNGCHNASFAFEFRTTQKITPMNVTLWYIDDGGSTDFFSVMLVQSRQVRLVLQLADSSDGGVEIILGHEVNDGRWHRVEVRRKRAVTFLVVDNETESGDLFGEHFNFGKLNASSTATDDDDPSHVFMGGIPPKYSIATGLITRLAMPSVVFIDKFRGSIRNVIYGNCTCHRSRASLIGGRIDGPPEAEDACIARNPCREGCLCISTEAGPTCDCSDLVCVGGKTFGRLLVVGVLWGGAWGRFARGFVDVVMFLPRTL
jgi:Laminin G domain